MLCGLLARRRFEKQFSVLHSVLIRFFHVFKKAVGQNIHSILHIAPHRTGMGFGCQKYCINKTP